MTHLIVRHKRRESYALAVASSDTASPWDAGCGCNAARGGKQDLYQRGNSEVALRHLSKGRWRSASGTRITHAEAALKCAQNSSFRFAQVLCANNVVTTLVAPCSSARIIVLAQAYHGRSRCTRVTMIVKCTTYRMLHLLRLNYRLDGSPSLPCSKYDTYRVNLLASAIRASTTVVDDFARKAQNCADFGVFLGGVADDNLWPPVKTRSLK